jgi:hypothetical protein
MIGGQEAPSHEEVFQYFKRNSIGKTWREWWMEQWQKHIDFYFSKDWYIIPLSNKSKRPVAGVFWSERSLTKQEAEEHVREGGNLGVVAGKSGLVILDYDSHEINPELLDLTLTCRSARGYLFFTREPFSSSLFEKLKAGTIGVKGAQPLGVKGTGVEGTKPPGWDVPRVDIMYAVLPLSITCTGEQKKHTCKKHDYRIREFIDMSKKILYFRDFVRKALGGFHPLYPRYERRVEEICTV